MKNTNFKFSFKESTIDSLDKLETAAKKLKDKIKISKLDDSWFKKINSNDYSAMARSIEEWIKILQQAELKKKLKNL
ncbi:MAG: hypothetical protein NZ903_01245 [Candidatus Micrarchaeota archaeon]|nr:hypothetical protein [Candidatus Micrarchaeota archaeon]